MQTPAIRYLSIIGKATHADSQAYLGMHSSRVLLGSNNSTNTPAICLGTIGEWSWEINRRCFPTQLQGASNTQMNDRKKGPRHRVLFEHQIYNYSRFAQFISIQNPQIPRETCQTLYEDFLKHSSKNQDERFRTQREFATVELDRWVFKKVRGACLLVNRNVLLTWHAAFLYIDYFNHFCFDFKQGGVLGFVLIYSTCLYIT